MKQISLKKVLSAMALTLVLGSQLLLVNVAAVKAGSILWDDPWSPNLIGYDAVNRTDLGRKDPCIIAANVIRVLLGLLGVIAVVLILYGGFKWMTAAGNEDSVEDAKKIIGAGIIGLLIVLAAYAISIFVIRSLLGATGANADLNDLQSDYN